MSNLVVRTPLSKIPLLNVLFCLSYKINDVNKVINHFLKIGDKFMPEMYLRQPGFPYSAFGSYTKNKQRIQKCIKTGHTKYIYRNKLDKACFQHYMAYGDFIELIKEEHNQIKS